MAEFLESGIWPKSAAYKTAWRFKVWIFFRDLDLLSAGASCLQKQHFFYFFFSFLCWLTNVAVVALNLHSFFTQSPRHIASASRWTERKEKRKKISAKILIILFSFIFRFTSSSEKHFSEREECVYGNDIIILALLKNDKLCDKELSKSEMKLNV